MLQEDNFDWRVLNTFIHHSKTATSDFKPSHPPTSSPKPWLSKAINHHLATGHWAQSKVTLQPPTKSWRGGSRGRETGKRKEGWRKGQKVENTEAAGRWREIVWSISSAIAVGGKSLKSTLLSSVLLRHSILSTHRMVPDTTERVISKWKFGWIETASHKKTENTWTFCLELSVTFIAGGSWHDFRPRGLESLRDYEFVPHECQVTEGITNSMLFDQ